MEKVAVTLKETEAVKVWFLIIIGACQMAWKGDKDYCDNNDDDDNNKIRFDVVHNLYRSNSKACECSHLKANAMSTIKLFSPNSFYFLFFCRLHYRRNGWFSWSISICLHSRYMSALVFFLLDWGTSNNTEINAYWSALGNCKDQWLPWWSFRNSLQFLSVLSFPLPFFPFYLLCYSSDLITFLIFPLSVDKLQLFLNPSSDKSEFFVGLVVGRWRRGPSFHSRAVGLLHWFRWRDANGYKRCRTKVKPCIVQRTGKVWLFTRSSFAVHL